MSSSTFTFKSQENTVINDNGTCNINQSITQSLPSHQIYDWIDVDPLLCIKAGDILYLNPDSANFEIASAADESTSAVVGVVEQTTGCGGAEQAKLVYQGRVNFIGTNTYTTRAGAVYYLADEHEISEFGSDIIRNGSLVPGTVCRPVYVGGNEVNSAIVINSLQCEYIPSVAGPDLIASQDCGDERFIITNSGDAATTSSVAYTVTSGSYVSSSAIPSGLAIGGTHVVPFPSSSRNFTITIGSAESDPRLKDTLTSTCTYVETSTLEIRVWMQSSGSAMLGEREPSNTTWFESDEFVYAGSNTEADFTGATISPVWSPAAIQIADSGSYSATHPLIDVTFQVGASTETYTFIWGESYGLWTIIDVPKLTSEVKSLKFR